MSEYKMNRVQITVLITVATITTGILKWAGKEDTEFKPMETFPPSNVAMQKDESKTGDSIRLNPETGSSEEATPALNEKKDATSMPVIDNIPEQEAAPRPASESQTKPENVQKAAVQPINKPDNNANDMPKDRPNSKPSTTKGESKLVPDSENPILNAPPANVTEVKGSDFYYNGIPAGQGDKF